MICYDHLDESSGSVSIPCGHKYCPSCFVQHMKKDNHCAMCRVGITMKKRVNQADLIDAVGKSYTGSQYLTHIVNTLCDDLKDCISSEIIPRLGCGTGEINRVIARATSGDFRLSIQGAMAHVIGNITSDVSDALNYAKDTEIPTVIEPDYEIEPSSYRTNDERIGHVVDPSSIVMQGMSQDEIYTINEEIRNGRTGGHWGVPTNPQGDEEILTEDITV